MPRHHYEPMAWTIGRLSVEEERRLVAETRPPHSLEVIEAARDRLVRAWSRLVEKTALMYRRRFPYSRVEFCDLVGMGIQAMLECLPKIDLTRKGGPANYVIRVAYNEMWIFDRQNSAPVMIPAGTLWQAFKSSRAKKSELRPETIAFIRAACGSSQAGGDDDNEGVLFRLVTPDHSGEVEEAFEARETVRYAMRGLNETRRSVVQKYFGLGGRDSQSLPEIAAERGVSHQRVSDIKNRAMTHMRSRLDRRKVA